MSTQIQELEKDCLALSMWHELYCVEYILNKMPDPMTMMKYNFGKRIMKYRDFSSPSRNNFLDKINVCLKIYGTISIKHLKSIGRL